MEPMQDFVAYLVKNLVDQPDEVDVKCLEGERGLIVEVRVDNSDISKVIGRKGKTIQSLRTLVTTVCARLGRKVRLELIED